MICARCEQPTPSAPCSACGEDPLLGGRWALESLLGQGASGTTWAASATLDAGGAPAERERVAIKEISLRGRAAGKARELIEREVRILRELDHPGVPSYRGHLTAGEGRGRALYLLQELIPGQTLSAEMETRRYSEPEVLGVVEELLEILRYLHGRSPPVVHRDVKPANVMRRPDGSLCLIDFGAVRDALKGDLGGSTVAGTFGYMAPEQFAGDASPASDLYGVGALAVALLAPRPHAVGAGPPSS